MSNKGIERTIQRVTQQQRNSYENSIHYQSGREWASFKDAGPVQNRRLSVERAVPRAEFQPGIRHNPEAHGLDGLDKGKTCKC